MQTENFVACTDGSKVGYRLRGLSRNWTSVGHTIWGVTSHYPKYVQSSSALVRICLSSTDAA